MIKLDDFKELVKFANEIADFLQIDTPKIEYNENVVDAERAITFLKKMKLF